MSNDPTQYAAFTPMAPVTPQGRPMFTMPAAAPAAPSFAATPVINGVRTSGPPAPDRFVILAGEPFSGKTSSAVGLTPDDGFPNPLVLNFDNKLPRKNVEEVPFWDDKFVTSLPGCARQAAVNPANRRDALKIWLADNARYCGDYTGVLDGLGGVETAFHQQTEDVEKIKGINGGLLFGKKLTYLNDIFVLMSTYFKRVVVTCHLAPVFGKDLTTGADVATGRMRPMVGGQFSERMQGYATSMIYCQARPKSLSTTGDLEYWWILKPVSQFNARTLITKPYPAEIPASYNEFKKYFTAD